MISRVFLVLTDVRGRVMPIIAAGPGANIPHYMSGGRDCQLLRGEWEEDRDMFDVIHLAQPSCGQDMTVPNLNLRLVADIL